MPHQSLREAILTAFGANTTYAEASWNPPANPGLLLSRYLIEQQNTNEYPGSQEPPARGKAALLELVSGARAPQGYERAYQRWRSTFEGRDDTRLDLFNVEGRMAVGIGEASVLETFLALLQPWGVPYIPGSALKGLAASYLRNVAAGENVDLKPPGEILDENGKVVINPNVYSVLFGTTHDAAYVTWHDAWWNPVTGSQPFHMDVITTHHPGYYQNSSTNPEPTDFDDPTPINFLSTSGKFLITLQGPIEWLDFAFEVLERAFKEMGIGAKTNAGYGRMKHVFTEYRWEPPRDLVQELLTSIDDIPDNSINLNAHRWVTEWKRISSESGKLKVARKIVSKVQRHKRTYRTKFEDPDKYGHEVLQYLVDNGGDSEP